MNSTMRRLPIPWPVRSSTCGRQELVRARAVKQAASLLVQPAREQPPRQASLQHRQHKAHGCAWLKKPPTKERPTTKSSTTARSTPIPTGRRPTLRRLPRLGPLQTRQPPSVINTPPNRFLTSKVSLYPSTFSTTPSCSVTKRRYLLALIHSFIHSRSHCTNFPGTIVSHIHTYIQYSIEQICESMREMGHSDTIIQALVQKL